MKRICVLKVSGDWMVILADKEDSKKYEIVFKSEIEEDCYDYLKSNLSDNPEVDPEDLQYALDRHFLMGHIPEEFREAVLYSSYSSFDRRILIRLDDGWMWGTKAEKYVQIFEKKLVIVPTIEEMDEVVKHIIKV